MAEPVPTLAMVESPVTVVTVVLSAFAVTLVRLAEEYWVPQVPQEPLVTAVMAALPRTQHLATAALVEPPMD